MWRCLRVGILLILMLPTVSRGQVSGEVLSIGFNNTVRPDCWTPMVVKINAETTKSESYQIRVRVQDMDRDQAVYTRTISVTGAAEGKTRQQLFATYFMPPPVDGGLPDAKDANSLNDLKDRLKVSVHTIAGKWIADLPITTTVTNVDPAGDQRSGFFQTRGAKLIIAVVEKSAPIYRDTTQSLLGVTEDVNMIVVRARDLPEKALGYEAVDAVVWFDADPNELKTGGDERFRAFQDYVRRGGQLVICQPFDWQRILALDDMLPVARIEGISEKPDLMPLREMAQSRHPDEVRVRDPFENVKPPYRFARAVAKPNAVVDEWITWATPQDRTPYIVRMPYALGSVTWVAQDLGDPSLVKSRHGWVNVWERIFDWKNDPRLVTSSSPDSLTHPYAPGQVKDFGKSLVGSSMMDLQSKSAWLITLAVMFFIGYWVLAGPGVYAWLATRRKAQWSWFAYGLTAVAATALTLLIVRLVLRGPPELRHFSVVKMTPNEPAVVISRFGLYIPRDGMQSIELQDAEQNAVTSICPLPIHPVHLKNPPGQTGSEYLVPVVDEAAGQLASVNVPYRSTLKKFQARWVGRIDGSVRGNPKLVADSYYLGGNLTNGTGKLLRNVYIAFHYPQREDGPVGGDFMLYIPTWEDGVTLNLQQAYNVASDGGNVPEINQDRRGDGRFRGRLDAYSVGWYEYWLGPNVRDIHSGVISDSFDDSGSTNPKSLIMMSLFDRLPPMKNPDMNRGQANRSELLRRGGRMLDMSGALVAGAMVVLATADGPIPIPMTVEDEPVEGTGTIFYQFVLPLDRSELPSKPEPTTTEAQ
jgi:hypothetical protein